MRTFAPAVQYVHLTPRGVLPPEENGKPLPQNYALRSTTIPKKEAEIKREESQENQSRKWHPFRRPALGTFQKTAAKEEEAMTAVSKLLEEIQDNLFNKAKKFLEEKITAVQNYSEFQRVLAEKGGFLKASWCRSATCEEKIKEETGATIRLKPFEKEEPATPCIYCREKAEEMVYFARSY
jgi:prolyl-tRNA synthetase